MRRELDEPEDKPPVPEGVIVAPEPVDGTTPLLTEEMDVQDDEEGAGCAEGVMGSPWENVDVPYTPIGSPESPLQFSKMPGV